MELFSPQVVVQQNRLTKHMPVKDGNISVITSRSRSQNLMNRDKQIDYSQNGDNTVETRAKNAYMAKEIDKFLETSLCHS